MQKKQENVTHDLKKKKTAVRPPNGPGFDN